jgi:nitrate/nitrite-specific signal transduction histidine kinase
MQHKNLNKEGNRMKKMVTMIGSSFVLGSTLYGLEIQSMSDAVNIAGKQRMYTQRMLKDYTMVGMGNTFGDPSTDLKKTMNDFSDHLISLQSYTKDDKIKESLIKVEALWQPIQKELQDTPSISKVEKLQENLEKLLKASDEVTKLFAKSSGEEAGEMVNIAGRQRMLSQRMASLYMLKVWGVEDPKFKAKLDDTLTLFKTSLGKLETSSLNNDESKVLLTKVKRSFMFFEMMNKSNSKFVPTLIYKKSDDILKNMNTVTHIYVKSEAK